MLAPILPRPIIPSCIEGYFGILILGAAHPRGNKIQWKDLSPLPIRAMRFASRKASACLRSRIFVQPNAAAPMATRPAIHQSEGNRFGGALKSLKVGEGVERRPCSSTDTMRKSQTRPGARFSNRRRPFRSFRKALYCEGPPNQRWRFCHFELVLLDHPGHGIRRGFLPSDLKNRLLALSTLISVTGGTALTAGSFSSSAAGGSREAGSRVAVGIFLTSGG